MELNNWNLITVNNAVFPANRVRTFANRVLKWRIAIVALRMAIVASRIAIAAGWSAILGLRMPIAALSSGRVASRVSKFRHTIASGDRRGPFLESRETFPA